MEVKYTNEALTVGLGPSDIGLVALSMKAPSLELEQGLRPPKASADHLLVFFYLHGVRNFFVTMKKSQKLSEVKLPKRRLPQK